MPRVTVNGWKFLYCQSGSGPDVVLLPGTASAAAGRHLLDALSADFRVTVFDARDGSATAGSWSSADIADDLRGLQDELGLGPSYLVGHGAANVAALHAAVLYPDMVAGLVLSEPCLPDAGDHAAAGARSGLTARRILLIDQPVTALCGQHSTALALCRFLAHNLPRCTAAIVPDDESKLAALIHERLREMAGVFGDGDGSAHSGVGKPGPRGLWPRLWPDPADGHAITRWVTHLSAWGL